MYACKPDGKTTLIFSLSEVKHTGTWALDETENQRRDSSHEQLVYVPLLTE